MCLGKAPFPNWAKSLPCNLADSDDKNACLHPHSSLERESRTTLTEEKEAHIGQET